MLSEPALNSLNKNGVPPHELHIKIGDICFIMRNLNVNDGKFKCKFKYFQIGECFSITYLCMQNI